MQAPTRPKKAPLAQPAKPRAELKGKEAKDKARAAQRPSEAKGTAERAKLDAARFRWLNEQLYTCTGEEAQELFTANPELFEVSPKFLPLPPSP